MKNKPAGKILSLVLTAAIALGVFAAPPMTAYAAMPTSTAGEAWDGVDFAALMASGSGIYYGTYKHATTLQSGTNGTVTDREMTPTPILWRVMGEEIESGTGDNVITLMSEYVLDSMLFHGTSNVYNGSVVQTFLAGTFMDSFTTGEKLQTNMIPTDVHTKTYELRELNNDLTTYNSTATGQQAYLLWGLLFEGADPDFNDSIFWSANGTISESESDNVNNSIYRSGNNDEYPLGQAYLKNGSSPVIWRLRSPGPTHFGHALYVTSGGDVSFDHVSGVLGVRPAFKLDPESVIFTSEILSPSTTPQYAGQAWATEADDTNYAAASADAAKNFKLTVLDSSSTETLGNVPTTPQTIEAGVDLALEGLVPSQTGADYTINYKIVGNDGSGGREIKSYGFTAAQSSTDLTLDTSGLADGSYTAYVWLQKNNDINSNEASAVQYFPLMTVQPGDAALVTAMPGLTSPVIGAVASNAATITSSEANSKTTANLTATVSTNATATYWSDAACTATELTGTGITAFPLSVGSNTAYIKVVSESAFVTNIYTVTVTRAAAAPPSTGGGSYTPSYTVSFNTNDGGTISSLSIVSGGKVTKPADPVKEGYTFGGWYADAALTKAYDFGKAVTSAFTLYAKWSLPFKDVVESAWYYDAVADVYGRGLMLGTADDLFGPDSTLTRAMIVTILYRSAGEPDTGGLNNPFGDAEEGQWYTNAVKWAAANGIVYGYGNGNFGTNDPVTKEQLAALLYRSQQPDGKTPANVGGAIPDMDKVSDWAKDAVDALNAHGIFDDIPSAEFNPQAPATRAEVASMLHRFLEA